MTTYSPRRQGELDGRITMAEVRFRDVDLPMHRWRDGGTLGLLDQLLGKTSEQDQFAELRRAALDT